MSDIFCTIITSNYIGYARALEESLFRLDKKTLAIFIAEWKKDLSPNFLKINKSNCYYLDDLCNEGQIGRQLYVKYFQTRISEFRWSMKGVFVNYLLNDYDKVVFLDGDLYFYSSTQFIWDLLDSKSIILTPHWRNIDVSAKTKNEIDNFELLHIGGLYNAGFIGANRAGREALNWLAEACLFRCEIKPEQGHFGDQTYLNMLPIYFKNIHVLEHQGCNVASWNKTMCRRTLVENKLLINQKFPIVFIHFTKATIFDILSGEDEKLGSCLDKYLEALARHGVTHDFRNEFYVYHNSLKRKVKRAIKPYLKRIFPTWKLLQ